MTPTATREKPIPFSARAEGGELEGNRDADYLAAMKEIYGVDLPKCQLMIGCSSEH